MIPTDDRGLLLGDGLFETLLAIDGALRDFEPHMARLAGGCAVLGLPAPGLGQVRAAAQQALSAVGLEAGRAAVRITWTAGSGGRGLDRPQSLSPRLIAGAAASPASNAPLRLVTASVRRNEGSPLSRLKSTSYADNVLARREARARGAEEALMLNNRGEVACAAAANLFWLEGETLFTPALSCGVLSGITRAAIVAGAPSFGFTVREVAAPPEALAKATALVACNSLIGVRPVSALDDRPLYSTALASRLRALTDRSTS